jgi:methylated-DNA-[protein]-cysteine S-methyltransferase
MSAAAARRLYAHIPSPLGPLLITGQERELWSISMQGQRWARGVGEDWRLAAQPFAETRHQLGQYFAGERSTFELPLRLEGSEFQQSVWRALARIPLGAVRSYGELAHEIGNPRAARAVGLACGRNPFAIVIPCHRLIGADGGLVDYGGGLERKRWLLEHEHEHGAGLPTWKP